MPYKDRDKYLSTQKSYYQKDPETYRWRVIKNSYSLSKEQFFELLEKQDAKCALCRKSFPSLRKPHLHIDHCHETNTVRGLLCLQCNVGLGMLGDNVEGLERGIKYLKGEASW